MLPLSLDELNPKTDRPYHADLPSTCDRRIDHTEVDTVEVNDTVSALPPHMKAVANAIMQGNNPIESVKLAFACSDKEARRLILKLRKRWLELTK